MGKVKKIVILILLPFYALTSYAAQVTLNQNNVLTVVSTDSLGNLDYYAKAPKKGRRFVGWSYDPIPIAVQSEPAGLIKDLQSVRFTEDTTLYAVYASINGGKVIEGDDTEYAEDFAGYAVNTNYQKAVRYLHNDWTQWTVNYGAVTDITDVVYRMGSKALVLQPYNKQTYQGRAFLTSQLIRDVDSLSVYIANTNDAVTYAIEYSNDSVHWTTLLDYTNIAGFRDKYQYSYPLPEVQDVYIRISAWSLYFGNAYRVYVDDIVVGVQPREVWYSDYSTDFSLAPSATLSFSNAGDIIGISASKVGESVVLPSATDEEREFLYWDIQGSRYMPGDAYILAHDVEAVAVWDSQPIVISDSRSLADFGSDDLSGTDFIIAEGGELTVTETASVRRISISGGGRLKIEEGATLHCQSISLQGGWNEDKSKFQLPHLDIAGTGSLEKEEDVVYFDYAIDADSYYPLSLPFAVAIDGGTGGTANTEGYHVRYAEDWLNEYATYREDGTGQIIIMEYDGASRASRAADTGNWSGVASADTLLPTKGYVIKAVPVGEVAVIRFEMTFDNAWTTNGEQTTISGSNKGTASVYAYGQDLNIESRHKGWNMIGSPFFGSSTIEASVPYVTIPLYDFSAYVQTLASETPLEPFTSFFVQMCEDAEIDFISLCDEQPSLLRSDIMDSVCSDTTWFTIALANDANDRTDRTTVLLSDLFSIDYEIGADLEKMFGSGCSLSMYSLADDQRLAFNALPYAEASLIPLGIRLPDTASYSISLLRSSSPSLQRADLIDSQTGTTTNLLEDSYSFTSNPLQDDSRFSLSLSFAPAQPTDLNAYSVDSAVPYKFIYLNNLYIRRGDRCFDVLGNSVMK